MSRRDRVQAQRFQDFGQNEQIGFIVIDNKNLCFRLLFFLLRLRERRLVDAQPCRWCLLPFRRAGFFERQGYEKTGTMGLVFLRLYGAFP